MRAGARERERDLLDASLPHTKEPALDHLGSLVFNHLV
jgi:hypothetical protein